MTAVAEVPVPSSPAITFEPLSTITADLMPDEIRVKRRLAHFKRRLVFVVAALVALLALGDAFVRMQTAGAQDDLASADSQVALLTHKSQTFNTLLNTQGETQAIRTQLAGVMTDDLSWDYVLNKLGGRPPAGLVLSSVAVTLTNQNSAASNSSADTAPTTSAQPTIGTVTLIGAAPNWSAIATYVSNLSTYKGVTAVTPSSVTQGVTASGARVRGMIFTIELSLTNAILHDPYASTSIPGAGVPSTTGTGATGNTATRGSATTTSTATAPSSVAHTAVRTAPQSPKARAASAPRTQTTGRGTPSTRRVAKKTSPTARRGSTKAHLAARSQEAN